jgi:hypothetical protein
LRVGQRVQQASCILLFAIVPWRDDAGGDSLFGSTLQGRGFTVRADNQHDLSVDIAALAGVDNRRHIRAASMP